MANKKHIDFLKQCLDEKDIDKWNAWMQDTDSISEKVYSYPSYDLRPNGENRIVDLSGADLKEADLSYAILAGSDLRRADLSDAILAYADLGRANLEQANLERANLRHAFLRRAFLKNTNTKDADFSGANVFEVFSENYDEKPSDLAIDIDAKEQLKREIAHLQHEKEKLEREKEELKQENSEITSVKIKTEDEKKEFEDAIISKDAEIARKDEEILKKNEIIQKLDAKSNKKIESAIEHLKRPNRYLDQEIIIYKRLFCVYLSFAILLTVFSLMVYMGSYFSFPLIGWENPLFPETPELYDYLHFHGPQISCLLILGLLVNLFSRTRKHIHELEERRRNVESLLGILFAIKELSRSGEKVTERIDLIMNELSKIAVQAFIMKPIKIKTEGDIEIPKQNII